MILVAVDDMLFSSKIRATAKLVGVELVFARTPADIMAQARTLKPSLVIFDINSGKADPINTVAALKIGPGAKHIPTAGFVSHVDTSLIAGGAGRRHGRGDGPQRLCRQPAPDPHCRQGAAHLTLADIQTAAGRIRGRVLRSPRPALALALEGCRRRGVPEAGDAAADRLVQDPRRHQRRPALIERAGRRWLHPDRHRVSRQSRTGDGARGGGGRDRADRVRRRRAGAAHEARRDPRARRGTASVPRLRRSGAAREASTAARHAVYISPYAHPDVIAGAGTVALEDPRRPPTPWIRSWPRSAAAA